MIDPAIGWLEKSLSEAKADFPIKQDYQVELNIYYVGKFPIIRQELAY